MFLLREICIEVSKSPLAGTLAPISFVLIYPFISTIGGYFYDYPEIAFFAASFLLALHKRLIWIIPIALVATLNKESFLFFIITLIPLIRPFASRYKLLIFTSSALIISTIVNLIVKSIYASNPGNTIEFHLKENMVVFQTCCNLLADPRTTRYLGGAPTLLQHYRKY
jgi:hypothetical protein